MSAVQVLPIGRDDGYWMFLAGVQRFVPTGPSATIYRFPAKKQDRSFQWPARQSKHPFFRNRPDGEDQP